jgi:iron complex transport system permease protein
MIVREIRMPRMLLACGVGAMLGLSGAAIQGLTRNPLAEPAVLGTPQAAALGAVAVLYTGTASANSLTIAIAAICGAGLSMGIILLLIRARQNILTLLLAGIGIGSLAGAAMSFIISVSPNPYAVMEIVFWLMGSFEDRSMIHVFIAFPFFVIAAFMLFACHNGYTALTLGEETAQSLGVNVANIAMLTAAGISIGIGAAVAVSGAIGFVGLIAPHIVRPWCNGNPGRALLPAALCGALLTTLADVLVRLIPSTGEVRIGVLTAFIGAPWFICLVVTRKGLFGGGSQ